MSARSLSGGALQSARGSFHSNASSGTATAATATTTGIAVTASYMVRVLADPADAVWQGAAILAARRRQDWLTRPKLQAGLL